jgi:ribosome biogenesis GTPase
MERVALGTAVCIVSAKTGQGFSELGEFLRPGHMVVLLGSSGVGKSTIANRLLGEAVQEVRPVRESDSRGRHTTTARELFILPGGALLMDTPGLREMQLWDAGDGVGQTFADIDSLAAQCHFGDCRHEGEPGCAVQEAIDAGRLDQRRVESRRKLLREQEFLRRKVEPEARHDWKNRMKRLHREVKRMYESRKKEGEE